MGTATTERGCEREVRRAENSRFQWVAKCIVHDNASLTNPRGSGFLCGVSGTTNTKDNRRPMKTRDRAWAKFLARKAAGVGLTPNGISLLSILVAAGAMVCFLIAPDMKSPVTIVLAWLGAAAGIQLRLLCNMLDGMVAVECGKKSPLGGLFNEVPDRIADVLILVGAGYATSVEPGVVKLFGVLPLGWSCAVAAVWTAYIRSIGAELTGKHFFVGPMAKPHRMAALTTGCFMALMSSLMQGGNPHLVMEAVLTVILAGSLFTCWRRLCLVSNELKNIANEKQT
jgi:phosphatidylglycerophosphate synthase